MNVRFPLIALAVATPGWGGLVVACTGSGTMVDASPQSGAGDDAEALSESGSAGADASADGHASRDAGASPRAYVRLALWSPDAPEADVCFNAQGASWAAQVPALGRAFASVDAAHAGDGGAIGLQFPQVTSYLAILPGEYSVRLVPAGSVDCTTDLVDLPAAGTFDANTHTTIAALGEAVPVGMDRALELSAFADDVTAPASQIGLRFINASPANPTLAQVDFGTGSLAGSEGLFTPLFTTVAFGQAGTGAADAGAVDVNGYLAWNALSGATVSVHAASGAQDTTTAVNDVIVKAGSAATIALVGAVGNGSAGASAKLLLCIDGAEPNGADGLAACSIVSTE